MIALGLDIDSKKKNTHLPMSILTQEGFSSNFMTFSAAEQVFVAFANPASVPFGVKDHKHQKHQKHKHCQLQTTHPTVAVYC